MLSGTICLPSVAPIPPPPGIRAVCDAFRTDGELVEIEAWPGGHINDSYLLVFVTGTGRHRYLLQRINGEVFPRPDQVMENVQRVTEHVIQRLEEEGYSHPEKHFLTLTSTYDNRAWYTDNRRDVWRMYPFIEGTHAQEFVQDAAQAETAAQAFGRFTRLVDGIPGAPLHEVLPGFHDTPARLEALRAAAQLDPKQRAHAVQDEIEFALDHAQDAGVFMDLLAAGELPTRVVHNDTKISNVLLSNESSAAICVVDLDTVMPGTALFDYGDMVRSMSTRAAEDECDLSLVVAEPELVKALEKGYLAGAGDALTEVERAHMPKAGFVLALELGARFLTDHILGDQYFRIHRPQHNLDRARAQFTLAHNLNQ